ncbi:LacI family DNA-binding transcriptional regulator [Antribacter gilvus]|uniref:LacI family DNA-binding transcriptional regulator n=1 Tax=Antribacter gilvus TaxID=2304675 RepID=UPI000F79E1F7|nr:LacI family DNA-binding transcriptional regulator [Antribacter gilvus]
MTDTGRRRAGLRTRPGPSLADVAARAGVSAQTVSRVSMGTANVRAETRARVLAAMDELGYAPNSAARALRSGSYGTIGMIAHRLSRTGESRTVEAVVEAARAEGFTVTLVDVESPSSDDVSAAATRLSHQAIDGLVIIRAETATPATLVLPPRLPVVVSDSRFVGHHPAVGADQTAGGRAAVEHLLGLGHRTVHHLAGPEDSTPAQVRAEAWRDALEAAGRPVPDLLRGDWTADSGYALGREVARDPDVTAVFCANDEMAAGLMRALHEAGRDVPGDVSVVGFDDIVLAAHLWPPLTTVSQDFAEIGRALVDLLLRQVREGTSLADVHTLVPVRLVVRASTAPPAA